MMRKLTVLFAVAVLFNITNALAQDLVTILNAAEKGNAEAQLKIGSMYEDGQGVSKDYGQAFIWYRKAAEQGNARAQFNLGFMYASGHGVSQDYSQAFIWYRKAAEQGNEFAKDKISELAAFDPDTKRDPNDVVAKVLNYSSFGKDEGTETSYWYQDKSDKCRYKLFSQFAPKTIDLNALDPRTITFENYGGPVGSTIIRHDANVLFVHEFGLLNLERLHRGWTLIYSKYCKGKEKAF